MCRNRDLEVENVRGAMSVTTGEGTGGLHLQLKSNMRRKSHRNATKASPEKSTEAPSRRSRRHSKRRKRSSSRSSSEEGSDDANKTVVPQVVAAVTEVDTAAEAAKESEVWKVTPSAAPSGEIQKLKICLTRPIPTSPEKTERSTRRRRNKSGPDEDIASPEDKVTRKTRNRGSPGVSVEEDEEPEEQEDKKGKGKSKTKHRSKSEKTPQIQEGEDQTQSEISENVQVTPQSPQAAIDIRVDNESVAAIENETVTTSETETCSIPQNTDSIEIRDENIAEHIPDKSAQDQTPPQSPDPNAITQHSESFDSQGNFKGFSAPEQNVVGELQLEQLGENVIEEIVMPAVQEEIVLETVKLPLPEQIIVLEQDSEAIPKEDEDSKSCESQEVPMLVSESVDIEEQPVTIEEQSVAMEEQSVATEEQSTTVEEQSMATKEQSVAIEEQAIDIEEKSVSVKEQSADMEEQATGVEIQDVDIEMQENYAQVQVSNQEEDSLSNEPKENKMEEQTTEVATSKESSKLPNRKHSKSESSSSEEAEHADREEIASPDRSGEIEEQVEESQTSTTDTKNMAMDETNNASRIAEGTHRSDEDSRSVDAIILDNSNTPSKDDTSFNLSKSFSPDVRKIIEANEELQDMRKEVSELFSSPKAQRKTNWGNSLAGLKLIKPTLNKINIDTIKALCPDLRFLEENEIKIDVREARDRRKSYSVEQKERRTDRKVSIEYKPEDADARRLEAQSSVNSSEMEEATEPEVDNSNIIAMNRKISIVDDTASKLKPPPSPAKNPISEVLFITNLVRPFTLKQLKELLERTGKIKENGFWTDRIKSKCYVHYDTIEEAEATRNALHGVHWPIGNGKKLVIDYATQEDLEKARNPTPPTPPPPVVPEPKIPVKEPQEDQAPAKRVRPEDQEKPAKDRERYRSEGHVREWDIGKENVQKPRSRSREREGRNERNDRRRHRRTPSPVEDFIARKQRKKEEDIPQKLMDDLFRKTKATPSIYWLPLTPEEIATKQQQRLLRMAEHKRRMEESTRSRGGDYGRGAPYRRRYD